MKQTSGGEHKYIKITWKSELQGTETMTLMYVHNDRSNNSLLLDSLGSPDLQFLSAKYRPFFLPVERTVVIVAAVCIPPDPRV